MIMAVAAARVTWLEFRQRIGAQQCEIRTDCPLLRLEHAHTGGVELMQRPAAYTANHNRINLMSAESRYRVTGAMLMNPVAVADRGYVVCYHVHHDKTRGRPKMSVHCTL